MSYFFNGRLYITPSVMSVVDDTQMFGRGLSVGNNVGIVGSATGGKPNTVLSFSSPDDARKTLRSGPLLESIVRAFDPSAETGAPATVYAVRVNPASQSALTLKNSTAADVITLASTDYGAWTTQIKVKIETGSSTGLKLTTQFGNDYYSQDNVARNAFSVQYGGAQVTAVMSITNSSLVLQAPSGTPVATIDLNTFDTVQKLVDRINTVASFTAAVLDGNGAKATLNGLDTVTAQDVKTALFTATANLQAVVDWFNSNGEGYVTATRVAGAGTVPANLPFTYLAGGTDGSATNTDWSNAFATLQLADVQWVVPASNVPAIHAMADSHVAYMSNVGQKERRAICGTPLNTSDATAITLAKAINSDRTSLVHLGVYDYDANSNLVLYEPYIAAAMVAGAFSGLNPGESMTNKSIKVRGLERDLRNPTDTDALILGGVLCLENTSTGYKVVQSISTWLTNDNYNRVEQSVGTALDFTVRNLRNALSTIKGQPGTPIYMSLALAKADTVLRGLSQAQPAGPGVLVGDANNPPYRNLAVRLIGDALEVRVECSPVIPINYIPITVHAVPYSGTASL